MDIDEVKYIAIPPQQRAWATSELLSKVIVYSYHVPSPPPDSPEEAKKTERETFAEEAILLKIPSKCVQDFLSVEELRVYMYKDAFHKNRRYWLLPKDSDYNPGKKEKTTAKRIEALWRHCVNNNLDYNGEVYILSVDRMDAILEIPGGHSRIDKKSAPKDKESPPPETIIKQAARHLKERNFELTCNFNSKNLPSDLKEFYTYSYGGRSGKSRIYKIRFVGNYK